MAINAQYLNDYTLTVSGVNVVNETHYGRRLLCDCSIDGYKSVTISGSSWNDPLTTVNLLVFDSDALTSNLVSYRYGPGVTTDKYGSVSLRWIDHDKLTNYLPDEHFTEASIDKYTQAEVDTISGSLQANINGKSDTSHNHNLADLSEKSYNSLTDKPTIPTDFYSRTEIDTISGSLSSEIDSDISTHASNTDAHHAESHTVASHSDTTATGAELEELTDGSDTTLHDHDGISENTAARHAESHTVASHSDTTASGSELNTLTDNSIADTLHRHSELVASDGSPDPVLSIDATGTVAIQTAESTNASITIEAGASGDRADFSLKGHNASNDGDYMTLTMRTDQPDFTLSVYDNSETTWHQFTQYEYLNDIIKYGFNKIYHEMGSYGSISSEKPVWLFHEDDSDTVGESTIGQVFSFRSTISENDGKQAKIMGVRETDWAGKVGLAFYTSPNSTTTTERLRIDGDGKVSLSTGTGINEFSTDTTLSGNSDDAVPTEKAVATYIDARGNTSLVDNSIANTLHRHSELVASDGSPDPALSVDGDGKISTNGVAIEINALGSGDRYAYIDLVGDDTYTDYGLRIIRSNAGVNTTSSLLHKGTGSLFMYTLEAGALVFGTSNTERLNIAANGDINIHNTLVYSPDTGVVLKLDTKTLLQRHTANGAISFGADDAVVIGCGESRGTTVANVNMVTEILHLSSDNSIILRSNMQAGWATANTYTFNAGDITIDGNTVWHAGNDGSGSGLDADKLDGYHASTTAGVNTIVQRTASGHVYANYFNTASADVGSGVTRVCVEIGNDGWIRHGTADAIRDFIGVDDLPIMPSFQMDYMATALFVNSLSWVTVAGGRIYIPTDGRTTLRMSCRIKVATALYGAYCRFKVGALVSNTMTTTSSTYAWYNTSTYDLDSLSGWQNLEVQLVGSNVTIQALVQGFSFIWE